MTTTRTQLFRLCIILLCLNFCTHTLYAQNNGVCTNTLAEEILLGHYNPASTFGSAIIRSPQDASLYIQRNISPDSIHVLLDTLSSFYNRNTASDTLSSQRGIGAARRWAYARFAAIGVQNGDRLIPSYLQFVQPICGVSQHRNVFAVLPGADTTDKSIILIEAHLDSRCSNVCDTTCLAQGIEDNGSGCALVMELARVMSSMRFSHSIVFLLTIAEEQGLNGATAFANYLKQKSIPLRAVFNNDIVGGVYCGKTASAPGCAMPGGVDSTDLRIFSLGSFNSAHKQLARYIKLQYAEQIAAHAEVPMRINIMAAEDRTGRGGDHIPFRQANYTAVRFTSANEHGDASNSAGYTDRQHTSADILGVDINHDSNLDSFYVDFKYCARNTVINGNAAAMLAIAPQQPSFHVESQAGRLVRLQISAAVEQPAYRVAVRSSTNDWDTVYQFPRASSYTITLADSGLQAVSVAGVDSNGVESLFSNEINLNPLTSVSDDSPINAHCRVYAIRPNPLDEVASLNIMCDETLNEQTVEIQMVNERGEVLVRRALLLHTGMNEVDFQRRDLSSGALLCNVYLGSHIVNSQKVYVGAR